MSWFPSLKKTARKSEDDYNAQKNKLLQEIQRLNSEIQRRREEPSPSCNDGCPNQQKENTPFHTEKPILIDEDESNHLIEQSQKEVPQPLDTEPEEFIVEHKINLLGCLKRIKALFPGTSNPRFRYLKLDGQFGKLTTGAERRIIRKKFWLLISICLLLTLAILSMISKL